MRFSVQQMQALGRGRMKEFEQRMVDHVRRCFPELFDALGVEPTLSLVQHGVARAAAYDLVSERDICRLVDMMLVLGPDLEAKYPWVVERLRDASVPKPSMRLERVHEKLLESLERKASQP